MPALTESEASWRRNNYKETWHIELRFNHGGIDRIVSIPPWVQLRFSLGENCKTAWGEHKVSQKSIVQVFKLYSSTLFNSNCEYYSYMYVLYTVYSISILFIRNAPSCHTLTNGQDIGIRAFDTQSTEKCIEKGPISRCLHTDLELEQISGGRIGKTSCIK